MATFVKTVLKPATGPLIQARQKVTVSANLYLSDGMVAIWSTHETPFLFPATGPFEYVAGVGGVITGWDDGCLTMGVGERARLEIPWQHAYCATGDPGFKIPGQADLVFDIEILSAK